MTYNSELSFRENLFNFFRRERHLKKLRRRNHNHDFTLVANNCCGGYIYHDLGLQFRSPTINLVVENFPLFVSHFEHYMTCPIVDVTNEDSEHPEGNIISDRYPSIHIVFLHYDSFEEGYRKWEERKARINYDNLFFLMECYDNYYPQDLQDYLSLPYSKNKAALVHTQTVKRDDVHYIACYTGTKNHIVWARILTMKGATGRRWLDDFDYVSFLNPKN